MAESQNGRDIDMSSDIRDIGREMLENINKYIDDKIDAGVDWQSIDAGTVPVPDGSVTDETGSETGLVSHDVCQGTESFEPHFISGVVFRRLANRQDWELESFLDHANIGQLDEIGIADIGSYLGDYKGHNDLKIAMTENNDVVLVRNIIDWSRADGNVWSQQIVWSGSFSDSRRMLLLMEMDSPSIQLRLEYSVLQSDLRDRYIELHGTFPFAAAISAVDSSPTVLISENLVGKGGGEDEGLVCSICHDRFYVGQTAKQLRCTHIYHQICIYKWFYFRLQCPLCREEFQQLRLNISPSEDL